MKTHTHTIKYIFCALLMTFIFVLVSAGSVMASDGSGNGSAGSGDGSGQGKNKNIPLTLRKSVPADEAQDIPTDVTIELHFNKNICHITVMENNKQCFHLTDENGEVIPVTLTVPDDQVQRTYKQDAFLTPAKPLAPGTRYRIAVDSTLQAKNGNSIDNAHVIEFTTGDKSGARVPAELTELGEMQILTYEIAYPENENSVPKAQPDAVDEPESGISMRTVSIIALCVIILIIVVSSLIAVKRRKPPV